MHINWINRGKASAKPCYINPSKNLTLRELELRDSVYYEDDVVCGDDDDDDDDDDDGDDDDGDDDDDDDGDNDDRVGVSLRPVRLTSGSSPKKLTNGAVRPQCS